MRHTILRRDFLMRLAACWLPAQLWAQLLPAAVLRELPQARLLGDARYRFWGFDIYQVRLWAEPDFDAAQLLQHRFALELQYLRAFKGADIARRSIEEMRRIGSFSDAQAQRWLEAMQQAFPDVVAGDRLTGLHLSGFGARFFANGRPLADIADVQFAQLFFGIWLAERTSEPALRQALLGQTERRASSP